MNHRCRITKCHSFAWHLACTRCPYRHIFGDWNRAMDCARTHWVLYDVLIPHTLKGNADV